MDFTGVVLLVFSFVAVALGHGAVAGEREDGTLAATLANPVPRSSLIAAKLAGGWVVLCVPLTVSSLAATVVASVQSTVAIGPGEWLRLAVYLGLCALFLATVYALSVMVSTIARRAATALMVCLLAWLVGGVGFLNALPFVTRYGVEMTPYEVFQGQRRQVWERVNEDIGVWQERNPPPPPAYMEAREAGEVVRYGHPRGYAWRQRYNAHRMELIVDASDEIFRYQRTSYEPLARMAHVVDRWSVLSPLTNFAALARQLARMTLDDNAYFMRAGHEYRRTYLQYLGGKDAFGSTRWFSDDPPDQDLMIASPKQVSEAMLAPGSDYMRERAAWVEAQEREAMSDPRRRLDLSDLPPFAGQGERSLAESLTTMTPGLAVMLLTLAVVVSVARMERYDPRP